MSILRAIILLPILLIILPSCATRKEINRFKIQIDYLEHSNAEMQRTIDKLDSLSIEQMRMIRTLSGQSDLYMRSIQEEVSAVRNALQESGLQVEEVGRKLDDVTAKLATPLVMPPVIDDSTLIADGDSAIPISELTTSEPSAELLFRQAFLYQVKGEYEDAITIYEQLLSTYPKSSFAHQAIYQLGESYYSYGKYDQSITYFSKLLKEHKKSLLVPSALYKMGLAYIELNNNQLAKVYLQQLMREYPRSNESKLAEEKLKGL